MGDAKRKSRKAEDILAGEARCIYCSGPAETLEHMPPVGMFRARQRPGAMEFAACEACNNGTRGADAVAAVMARLHPDDGEGTWQAGEIRKLIPALDARAPGVREEMSRSGKAVYEWIPRSGSGLLQKVVRAHADGPLVKGYLTAFGAKLGMALYREHVGTPLPLDGAVWCQFALSGGMTQKVLDARVQILPGYETLRQGTKHVSDQFAYRFNTDERTVVAAVAQYHKGLWFTLFASSDPRIVELFVKPEFLALPASAMVRPGGVLALLPALS